jgi:hypothetical protein
MVVAAKIVRDTRTDPLQSLSFWINLRAGDQQ